MCRTGRIGRPKAFEVCSSSEIVGNLVWEGAGRREREKTWTVKGRRGDFSVSSLELVTRMLTLIHCGLRPRSNANLLVFLSPLHTQSPLHMVALWL